MAIKDQKQNFESYWSDDKLKKDNTLITGSLRINAKNFEEAFISHPDGNADVLIEGMKKRNRSFNGDIVYVKLFPEEEWKVPLSSFKNSDISSPEQLEKLCLEEKGDGQIKEEKTLLKNVDIENVLYQIKNNLSERFTSFKEIPNLSPGLKKNFTDENGQLKFSTLQQFKNSYPDIELLRTGRVVAIKTKVHSRKAAGVFRLMKDKSTQKVLFIPRDSRFPRVVVLSKDLPKDFFTRISDYNKTLFVVKITNWIDTANMPLGEVHKGLGSIGDVASETEAILLENDVDAEDFSKEVLACLAPLPRTIPPQDLLNRKDFRRNCVFTIDPDTAKDLDDAISCEQVGEGLYEVGVHIADVSYYVKEDTALDEVSSKRSFSVYLVQKVIPMLPGLLCEELCSLNPGVDRLTYSVVWIMKEDGTIVKEWIGRTVIRSCAKFAYRHIQGFIDEPEKSWSKEELPTIYGGFSIDEIIKKSLILHKLTTNMKQERMSSGSLRLEQKKLSFALHPESGFPNTVSIYERTDSHFLIEELMLKANVSVANFILKCHPNSALLRCHPPPTRKGLENFNKFCDTMNMSVDSSSSGALQEYFTGISNDSLTKFYALVHHCLKSMNQAVYVANKNSSTYRHHYALNFPCYTHFTSPIRRYADLLVHRQLSLALNYQPWKESILTNPNDLQKQCEHINNKKSKAKAASEKSIDLYFTIFLRECGPMDVDGVVIDLLDKSFDILVCQFGVNKRIKLSNLPLESFTYVKNDKGSHMELEWSKNDAANNNTLTQKIRIFTQLKCRLVHAEETFTWEIEVKHPGED